MSWGRRMEYERNLAHSHLGHSGRLATPKPLGGTERGPGVRAPAEQERGYETLRHSPTRETLSIPFHLYPSI